MSYCKNIVWPKVYILLAALESRGDGKKEKESSSAKPNINLQIPDLKQGLRNYYRLGEEGSMDQCPGGV